MSDQSQFKVNDVFWDPIKDPKIRQDGISDATHMMRSDSINENLADKYNPLIGYFSMKRDVVRFGKQHTGFDYLAREGTNVYAVCEGRVQWIRIGTTYDNCKCKIRERLADSINKENNFPKLRITQDGQSEDGDCKKCTNKQKGFCYGVQVFLAIEVNNELHYAFYAHLSKLDDNIWNAIKDKISKEKCDYYLNVHFKGGDTIGEVGCTGNAFNMKEYQEHLHFENRKHLEKSIDEKTGKTKKPVNIPTKRQTPNDIVKTGFYMHGSLNSVKEDREIIRKKIKWYTRARNAPNSHLFASLNLAFHQIDKKKSQYINKYTNVNDYTN